MTVRGETWLAQSRGAKQRTGFRAKFLKYLEGQMSQKCSYGMLQTYSPARTLIEEHCAEAKPS